MLFLLKIVLINIVATKYLTTINLLRKSFSTLTLPKNFLRTISFKIFPTKSQKVIFDKWFDEIGEIKYLHFHELFENFKKGKINPFAIKKLDYKSLYKGKDFLKNLKKTYHILCAKTEEGIRTETLSTLNSFVVNTKRIFLENKETLSENEKKLKKLKIDPTPEFNKLSETFKSINFPFKDIKEWEETKILIEKLNSEIGNLNYQINQISKNYQIHQISKNKIFLTHLKKLPKFPLLEKYPTLNDFKNRFSLFEIKYFLDQAKKQLEEFEEKYLKQKNLDFKKITDYLNTKSQKLFKKIKPQIKTSKKAKSFKIRFFYWYFNFHPSINDLIDGLKKKLEKEKNHLFKKPFDPQGRRHFFNTLFLLTEILYLSQIEEKKREKALAEINSEISKIKSLFLKGKSLKDTFLISGFSWKEKPLKSASLFLVRKNHKKHLGIVLALKNSVYCFKENHPKEIEFLALKGGSRKKSLFVPKHLEIKLGHLEKENDNYCVWFLLHHGKSFLRRFLFHKDWGFLNENPTNKLFPTNARFKRIKERPGDEFQYYVDISFQYEGKIFTPEIKNKIKYFIGIDRGEKVPIAYAVIGKEKPNEVLKKGIIGKELGEILKKIQKERKKGKRIRKKIRMVQETLLHSSISKILNILAEFPGLIILEKLQKGFGKEKSLIAKRVYQKIENFLFNSLQLANLPKFLIWKVLPKDTSIICPSCGFNFNEEIKRKIFKKMTPNKFKKMIKENKINLKERYLLLANGKKFYLPEKWKVYFENSNYPVEIDLKKIQELINKKDYKKSLELFQTISPRPSQDKFECGICGFSEDADIVGAINIAKRGLENYLKYLEKTNPS